MIKKIIIQIKVVRIGKIIIKMRKEVRSSKIVLISEQNSFYLLYILKF